MSPRSYESFHDQIVRPDAVAELSERFFDRFVFNLHPVDAPTPVVLFGLGLHPTRDTVDGFAILCTPTEQRNARFATRLSATTWDRCGPFSYEVVEPNRTWRVALRDNPTNMTFDLTWTARAPAWWGDVEVGNALGAATSFAHLFQSGWMSGSLTIDGRTTEMDRWYSQRDRSRGVRTMSGGQGLHVWFQAQFPDRSVGFLLVETRDGDRLLLEGGVMHVEGRVDDITDVRHDLVFDDQLDLKGGQVEVRTDSAMYAIDVDASASGGLMAGGGYGGHHGKLLGIDHVEGETWPLDGTVTQRTVDTSLTDRLCVFDWAGVRGSGILEFALSRSSSYVYRPTAG